ncbi:MAG: ABC transporter permease [Proteobacteria bacterium]|nr:ABC transporter permease [Pseudomonadota bacterium]
MQRFIRGLTRDFGREFSKAISNCKLAGITIDFGHIRSRKLLSPSSEFLFGTDPPDRDFFSRGVYGARTSLEVGLTVICFQVLLSTLIGTLSVYFGGVFDTVVQRIVDTMMCIPWLVFMLLMMAVLGPGKRNLILAMVLVGWAAPSRVIRGTG